ncbi:MAG: Cgl0159 family (beta/alpha)8-fold protein [Candidatus Nanopelagicales bacterium]|jgi:DhnA family fructose-bisphosphate aldolase class Ia
MLDRHHYAALCESRIFEPASLQRALRDRKRRTLAGKDGNLLILAADHTARGMIAVGSDPLAVADRYELLDRLMRGLSVPGVDGVMASADILEELAWLGALDGRVAIGTINRGGIKGALWELDDRITAYDPEHIASAGLDAGKLLLRIEFTDPGVARTIEMCGEVVTKLADQGIACMVEPLPYLKDDSGHAYLDTRDEELIRAVAIASGLGSSSAYTWLKIPATPRMAEVAAATTMPILLLGGDPGDKAGEVIAGWEHAMGEPNVRGLIPGRALLYPHDGNVEGVVATAARIVHGHDTGGQS